MNTQISKEEHEEFWGKSTICVEDRINGYTPVHTTFLRDDLSVIYIKGENGMDIRMEGAELIKKALIFYFDEMSKNNPSGGVINVKGKPE